MLGTGSLKLDPLVGTDEGGRMRSSACRFAASPATKLPIYTPEKPLFRPQNLSVGILNLEVG